MTEAMCGMQAYALQARHLLANPSRAVIKKALEDIPEEEQAWVRPMHRLRPGSALGEQLDSLIPHLPPEEAVPAALELIHAWVQAQEEGPLGIPDSALAYYA